MPQQHTQAFCQICQRLTMHVRDEQECPHIVYALMSLFCFVLFLPIWLIHSTIVISKNNNAAFRCTVCGSIAQWQKPFRPQATGNPFKVEVVNEPPPTP